MYALVGVNVLTLETGISAPLCSRLFGDLGAEVVKVEQPGVGDVHRSWDETVYGHSAAHVWVDRNKLSVELDLKTDRGRAVFLDLASDADIVIQNLSPGTVDRLGVSYDDVRADNEAVIYINISGFGRDGPYSERKAYDLIMQGETGVIPMNGHPEAPAKIPLSICDMNAGLYAALGGLTALFNRERTERGTEIDVSMFEGMLSALGYFPYKYWYAQEVPDRVGMRHHLLTPYGPHETSDGEYVNFAVLSPAHWGRFCRDVIERPELATDPRFATNQQRMKNRDTLEPEIEAAILAEPRDHWATLLEATGIPWGDVNRIDEVLDHPQTEHLGAIQEIETPDGPVKAISNPITFDGLETRQDPMPRLGADTHAVLRSLGYTEADIDQLEADGII